MNAISQDLLANLFAALGGPSLALGQGAGLINADGLDGEMRQDFFALFQDAEEADFFRFQDFDGQEPLLPGETFEETPIIGGKIAFDASHEEAFDQPKEGALAGLASASAIDGDVDIVEATTLRLKPETTSESNKNAQHSLRGASVSNGETPAHVMSATSSALEADQSTGIDDIDVEMLEADRADRFGHDNIHKNRLMNPVRAYQAAQSPINSQSLQLAAPDHPPVSDFAMLDAGEALFVSSTNTVHEKSVAATAIAQTPQIAEKAGVQIVAAISAKGADTSIEVMLDPPELGRVMIDFEGRGADIVRATVSADAAETLELMRRNLDLLQRELEKHGFENVDLTFKESHDKAHGSDDHGNPEAPGDRAASVIEPPAYMLASDRRLDLRL